MDKKLKEKKNNLMKKKKSINLQVSSHFSMSWPFKT